jgi:hypothetical protein
MSQKRVFSALWAGFITEGRKTFETNNSSAAIGYEGLVS